MSEQNGEGQVQSQSLPSNDSKNDRMAFYLQENGLTPKTEGKVEEVKPSTEEKDAGVKPVPEASPVKGDGQTKEENGLPKGAQRRIDVLTKRNKAYETQLKSLEAKIAELEGKSEKGKQLKRENFINGEEYQAHLITQKANEAFKNHLIESQKQQEEAQRIQQFQSTWAEKAQRTMLPEEMTEYREMISEGYVPEEIFSPEMLQYLEYSDVGVKMMYELMKNQDIVEKLKALPPIVLGARLAELERYTQGILSQRSKPSPTQQAQTQQKPVSQAPDPIGQVNAGGASTSPSDADLYEQYSKKRR